jgi:putative two-component system response regulator
MKHILIVDDNLTNLQQISIQIEDEFDLTLAKSGTQALQICLQEMPDIILLDIEMPEMDGFETLEQLRRNVAYRQVPVIFLTATRDAATERRAIQAGASDYLIKPCERDVLLHRINLHLALASYSSQMEDQVKNLEDSLVRSFSSLIESRDDTEGGHILRTARYVEIIAGELFRSGRFPEALNEATVDMIHRAAPLHDVGKIGVSDSILRKPSLLNDEEFAIMKTHTTMGAKILKGIFSRLPPEGYHEYAVLIALYHHERWDGKGYPNGLRGQEIPLCARIMSLADVFDALVDVRVYKKPMNLPDAIRVIISGSGTVFDPAIVEAFQDIKEEICLASKELKG